MGRGCLYPRWQTWISRCLRGRAVSAAESEVPRWPSPSGLLDTHSAQCIMRSAFDQMPTTTLLVSTLAGTERRPGNQAAGARHVSGPTPHVDWTSRNPSRDQSLSPLRGRPPARPLASRACAPRRNGRAGTRLLSLVRPDRTRPALGGPPAIFSTFGSATGSSISSTSGSGPSSTSLMPRSFSARLAQRPAGVMRRVLFRIGRVPIHSYPAMLYVGIVLGLYAQLDAGQQAGVRQAARSSRLWCC